VNKGEDMETLETLETLGEANSFLIMDADRARKLADQANRVEYWLPGVLAKIGKVVNEYAMNGHSSCSRDVYSLFADGFLSNIDEKMPVVVKELEKIGYQVEIHEKAVPVYIKISWERGESMGGKEGCLKGY